MARRKGYRLAQLVNAFLLGTLVGVALLATVHPRTDRLPPRPPPARVSELGLDADPDVYSAIIPALEVNRRTF